MLPLNAYTVLSILSEKGFRNTTRLQLQLAKNTRHRHCTFKERESLILLLDRVNGSRADNITLYRHHREGRAPISMTENI